MRSPLFSGSWASKRKPRLARQHSTHERAATRHLAVEQLEDRLVPSFGTGDGAYLIESFSGSYNAVQIQPSDQKIVAAGWSNVGMLVGRYDSLGSTDTSYGSGGFADTAGLPGGGVNGRSLTLQPLDGKAVVAGSATLAVNGSLAGSGSGGIAVARLNTNGSLDSSFGSGGATGFRIPGNGLAGASGVSLQSTGKVVVAGSSYPNSGGESAFVARFTAGGAIDSGKSGFGTQGKGYTQTTFGAPWSGFGQVAIDSSNRVVAVGSFSPDGNNYRLVVARYTASGMLDTTFNGSGYAVLLPAGLTTTRGTSVALQTDGKIVVAGSSSGIDGYSDMLLARFNVNGTLDSTFGSGNGWVRFDIDGTATAETAEGLVIQPDGKIVAAGWENPLIAGLNILVVRFNADGTPDSTFSTGGYKLGVPGPGFHDFIGHAVALESNGNIIVAGSANAGNTGDTQQPLLMRFFGTSSLVAASLPSHPTSSTITVSQATPLLAEALHRWQAAGVDTSALGNLDVRIADLSGATLGLASGHTIYLDANAAGWGWFVDPTPGDDAEFTTPGNQGERRRMDLLTVLEHEIGHLLGYEHEASGVMQDTLSVGTRRTPVGAEVGDQWAILDLLFAESLLPNTGNKKGPHRPAL